jgi:hypothetical protein
MGSYTEMNEVSWEESNEQLQKKLPAKSGLRLHWQSTVDYAYLGEGNFSSARTGPIRPRPYRNQAG